MTGLVRTRQNARISAKVHEQMDSATRAELACLQDARAPRCKKCDDTGRWAKFEKGCLIGGYCDCHAAILARMKNTVRLAAS